jgi:hypothetical protein
VCHASEFSSTVARDPAGVPADPLRPFIRGVLAMIANLVTFTSVVAAASGSACLGLRKIPVSALLGRWQGALSASTPPETTMSDRGPTATQELSVYDTGVVASLQRLAGWITEFFRPPHPVREDATYTIRPRRQWPSPLAPAARYSPIRCRTSSSP